jgi:RNA polymerase sigma-70 factor (ECF subfamily)
MLSPESPVLPPTGDLFEDYGPMVYRRCRRLLGEHDAPDAVQEVFMRVVEKRELFRGDSAPSTWLYRVATLHCLQRLRNSERRRGKLELLKSEPTDHFETPLDDHLALLHSIHDQPEETRLMLFLRYVDGLSMQEVAEIVGRSRKTVAERVKAFVEAARIDLAMEPDAP